ncbi:hypothetical protein BraRD5C2_67700 [Bradyrhizobium sp. RD5-C2]|nr:hypothetical protein BraRD5C2_67700 [Bradyrhizobium sp. RD5-C2]
MRIRILRESEGTPGERSILLMFPGCELISKLTTDKTKKELFAKLAAHHRTLADEVERTIKDSK